MPRFEKGKSGNPNGRPKSNLNKLLSLYVRGKVGSKVREQLIVEKVTAMAIAGDLDAVKFIWDRLEGKVKEQLDLTSGGAPATFTINMGGDAK